MARHAFRQARLLWPLLAVAALTTVLTLSLRSNSRATSVDLHTMHHGGAPMTEAAMRAWVDQWFATHPKVGLAPTSVAIVADTFLVGPAGRLIFDTDGNLNTPVDTSRIHVGDTILWQWISGTHTITSGTGLSDPQAGALFDVPSNTTSTQFQFTFNNQGTFPFFCRLHDTFGMKGVVVVNPPLSVPGPGGPVSLGFAASPAPNPTRSSVAFQFALQRAGRVRVEVFDSRGRLVATALNRQFDAGSHASQWDGRTRTGGLAPAGVYYLRLQLPGYSGTRSIVIER